MTLFGTVSNAGAASGPSASLQGLWAILVIPLVMIVMWACLAIRRKYGLATPSPARDVPHPLLKYVPGFLRPKDKPPTPGMVGAAELEAARAARLYRDYRSNYVSRRDGRATPDSDESVNGYDGASQTGTGTYINALSDEPTVPTVTRSSLPPMRQTVPTLSEPPAALLALSALQVPDASTNEQIRFAPTTAAYNSEPIASYADASVLQINPNQPTAEAGDELRDYGYTPEAFHHYAQNGDYVNTIHQTSPASEPATTYGDQTYPETYEYPLDYHQYNYPTMDHVQVPNGSLGHHLTDLDIAASKTVKAPSEVEEVTTVDEEEDAQHPSATHNKSS